MGMLTSGRVDIAAPAKDVFEWLIEPAKLTTWMGAAGAMPEDSSQLHVGWSSTSDSPPMGKVTTELIEYEPPIRLTLRTTYPGGDSISGYTLTEGDGKTTVVLEGDTDWSRPEGAWDAAIDKQLEGQPADIKAAAEAQFDKVEEQLEQGDFDDLAKGQMQQSIDASLQKLKTLVEAAA
ncbi:hypothetical protein BH09ACT4_BH09ACT4_07480 [soil metagenome]